LHFWLGKISRLVLELAGRQGSRDHSARGIHLWSSWRRFWSKWKDKNYPEDTTKCWFRWFFFEGFNPFSVSDEVLGRKTANIPIVRIHPVGIGNGPYDPGGMSFLGMLMTFALIALIGLLFVELYKYIVF
jgi:hypothetical protein